MQRWGGGVYIDLYYATGNKTNQNTDISSILHIILPDLPILCMSHFYFLCSVEVVFLYIWKKYKKLWHCRSGPLIMPITAFEHILNNTACFICRKCKTHPGPVVHISCNPVDPNKVRACREWNSVLTWKWLEPGQMWSLPCERSKAF